MRREGLTDVDCAGFPDLRRSRALAAVAQGGSLMAAAKQLRISQPAVSYLIAKLENEVGAQLVVRTARGSVLTEAGRIFAARNERFLAMLCGAVDTLADSCGSERRVAAVVERLTRAQASALLAVWRSNDPSASALAPGGEGQSRLRALRALEQLVATPLLERAGARLQLNAGARELARGLSLASQEITAGLQSIGAPQPPDTRSLRIGALVLSPRLILAQALEACTAEDPRHSIEVTEGAYEDLVVMLRAGAIDLIYGALRAPPPFDDLVEERHIEDPYVVVCRRGHPFAQKTTISRADFAQAQFVIPTAGLRQSVMNLLMAEWNINARQQIHTSWLPTLIALVRSTDRLAILSRWHIDMDGAFDLQALTTIRVPHKARHIGVTCRAGWLPTKFQQLFLDRIAMISLARAPEPYNARD